MSCPGRGSWQDGRRLRTGAVWFGSFGRLIESPRVLGTSVVSMRRHVLCFRWADELALKGVSGSARQAIRPFRAIYHDNLNPHGSSTANTTLPIGSNLSPHDMRTRSLREERIRFCGSPRVCSHTIAAGRTPCTAPPNRSYPSAPSKTNLSSMACPLSRTAVVASWLSTALSRAASTPVVFSDAIIAAT